MPAYANGYLLFVSESTLMAHRFDSDRLQMAGEALPLVNNIQVGGAPSSTGAYAVSETGVLVYQPGASEKSTLVWFGQDGKELAVLSDPQDFSYVQLSPNQRQVAVSVMDDASGTRDLWIYDATRRARTRFTDVPTDDFAPAWSPKSDRLAFIGRRDESRGLNLYEKSSDGTGEKRLLDRDGLEIPTSWSSDGQFILFQSEAPAADIWVLPLATGSAPLPFANTRFSEASAQFSPDDRWIAYSSNETGRTEIYVAPFRRTGARVPISTEGGGSPRWGAEGKELFYIRGDNTLMAVPLRAGESSIDVGTARPVFRTQFRNTALPYAVASDGRFLVNRSTDDAAPTPIRLVVNWPATLRK
jgi:dipeptidyl aminopeptidase/acylaminoacyl peptidase